MTPIAIYGLPRSGTNALTVLLARNLPIQIESAQPRTATRKHGTFARTSEPTVAIVRHPFSWLAAHYRTLPQRERTAWPTWDIYLRSNAMRGPLWVSMWNFAAGYYLWHPRENTTTVTYETLLSDPASVVQQVAAMLHCEPPAMLNVAAEYVAPHATGETLADIRKRELKDRMYLRKYTPKQLQWVRKHLDGELCEALYGGVP